MKTPQKYELLRVWEFDENIPPTFEHVTIFINLRDAMEVARCMDYEATYPRFRYEVAIKEDTNK